MEKNYTPKEIKIKYFAFPKGEKSISSINLLLDLMYHGDHIQQGLDFVDGDPLTIYSTEGTLIKRMDISSRATSRKDYFVAFSIASGEHQAIERTKMQLETIVGGISLQEINRQTIEIEDDKTLSGLTFFDAVVHSGSEQTPLEIQ